MANAGPSYAIINPSFQEPGFIMPVFQASGAFQLLDGEAPANRLGQGDLYVYIKRMEVRTQMANGQAAYEMLPSTSTAMEMIQAPSYLQRVRAEWNHLDAESFGKWGMDIQNTNRFGMRQGHYQLLRINLLYGTNPQNGEGIVNAIGATALNLPPDTFSNDTIVTYDNGQMGIFLLSQIGALKTRTNQLGIGHKVNFVMPQRVLQNWEYQGIVQLTSYQRPGAGSETTAGLVKAVGEANEDEVLFTCDDTLIGKGSGGHDLIVMNIPKITQPSGKRINTNYFAGLMPNLESCSLMYLDRAAPTEIPTPIPGGAIDVVSEMRATPGWAVRPETVTLISAQYQ